MGPFGTLLAGLLALLKQFGTLLFTLFKYAKFGKFLLTGGTMLVSAWFYALIFGWAFGVGIVLLIFVHEMGHVVAAATQGVPVSAPVFLPGMGALIMKNRNARSAFGEAIIGIGGPIGGALASLACAGLFLITNNEMYRGLAFFGFMMNLFNMMPIYPLDGGRIVSAIHPWLWAGGIAIMAALMIKGYSMGPLLFILIIMGLPRLWYGIKTGSTALPGQQEATLPQRLIMGTAYVGLIVFLAIGMRLCYNPNIRAPQRDRPSSSGQVVMLSPGTHSMPRVASNHEPL